jgi:hypothetical protein
MNYKFHVQSEYLPSTYGTKGAFTMFSTYLPYVASLFFGVKIVMASSVDRYHRFDTPNISGNGWNDAATCQIIVLN